MENNMSAHLQMRSANPAMSAFKQVSYGQAQEMTINGTINKTLISLFLLMLTAVYSWGSPSAGLMMFGGIAGFVLALITAFKPVWAMYTVPAYAVCEGLFLGSVSVSFERMYPGIVSQAIFLTFGILMALLMAYRSGLIPVTEKFKLGVVAATGGIALIYVVSMICGFFGGSIPLIQSSSTFGILFSVFVVIIASLNLVLDFDLIEQGAERGAPKYFEWYGAFALMVTLIWLYLEILRLLSKLQSRR